MSRILAWVVPAIVIMTGAYLVYLKSMQGVWGVGVVFGLVSLAVVVDWLHIRSQRPEATDLVDRALTTVWVVLFLSCFGG